MNKSKVNALIALLDDPNEAIFSSVENELLKSKIEVVDELEKAWEHSNNDIFQRRVENIIHSLQLKDVKKLLCKWHKEGGKSLFYGAFLVAKFQYPSLNYEVLNSQLEKYRKDVWLEINDHLTSLEKIRIINHIMFDLHKFVRNTSNFYSPQNSFINDVLDSKKGNPISLSIIYAVIARRLGLPVYGVNLPKNFILCFLDENSTLNINRDSEEQVMFYINPVNKGAILGRREVEYFLKQQKLAHNDSYYLPCSNIDIVKRVLLNLLYAYKNQGSENKVAEIEELMSIFE